MNERDLTNSGREFGMSQILTVECGPIYIYCS